MAGKALARLVVALAVVAAGCGDGGSGSEPFEPALGDWAGTTSEGLDMGFRLFRDPRTDGVAVIEASVRYRVLCTEAASTLGGEVHPLEGRRLSVEDSTNDTTFTFEGTFESETTAAGTLRIFAAEAGRFGLCAGDETLDWTAVPEPEP
jgi:hypothetical protein